jgi:HAD superfamily hydrolase (TIGR01509 family)
MKLTTVFLDAGGVLVHPGWPRISATLASHGVHVSPGALAAADPRARYEIDEATIVGATTDRTRGWLYFEKVLGHAGVALSDATERALQELREYHRSENLWEHLPDEVAPTLEALRSRGFKLVVVSNANGRLHRLFDRLDLARRVDVILDSHEWGVEKPDVRLFEIALEQAGARAMETVHVGDLYHVDVAGARRAGLRGAVLVDAANLYPYADCPRIPSVAYLIGCLDDL